MVKRDGMQALGIFVGIVIALLIIDGFDVEPPLWAIFVGSFVVTFLILQILRADR